MSLVELRIFYTQIEADLARTFLASQGIETYIFDTSSNYLGALTGYRLMVAADDKERAEQLLEVPPRDGEGDRPEAGGGGCET
jgi:hypothetical protein